MAKMQISFDKHIRDFETESLYPDRVEKEIIKDKLAKLVKNLLSKRGIYGQPPSFLGYSGSSWKDEGVFIDLVRDCYSHVFGRNLQSLKNSLLAEANTFNAVWTHVANFVHDRQKAADPIGFKVFICLRDVIADLRNSKQIYVSHPDMKIPAAVQINIADINARAASPDQVARLLENDGKWQKAIIKIIGRPSFFLEQAPSLILELPEHGILGFILKQFSREVARFLREKHEEFQVDVIAELKSAKKVAGKNRTPDLVVSYLNSGQNDSLMDHLEASKLKLDVRPPDASKIPIKRVQERRRKFVEILIESLSQGTRISNAEIARQLDIDRRRMDDLFSWLRLVLPSDLEI